VPPAAILSEAEVLAAVQRQRSPAIKNKISAVHISVVGDTSTSLSTPEDDVCWFWSGILKLIACMKISPVSSSLSILTFFPVIKRMKT
jgi:hypothetical protein